MSPDSSVYSGMTYGVYPVQQLRVLRPDIASINNDNFMFFALVRTEAYPMILTSTMSNTEV